MTIGLTVALIALNAAPASARCAKTANSTGYSMKRNTGDRKCEENLTLSVWEFLEVDLASGGKGIGLGKECAKVASPHKGRWEEGCTKEVGEAKGEWEKVISQPEALPLPGESFPVTLTLSGGSTTLETVGGQSLTATGVKGSGELTNAIEGAVSFDFTGVKIGKTACTSAGDATETVLVVKAKLQVVDLMNASKITSSGVAITLPSAIGIKCGIVTVEVTGSVLGAVNPVEESAKTHFEFVKSKGVQGFKECNAPEKLCEKPVSLKASFGLGLEEAGLSTNLEVTFAKAMQFFL
jgi:hypothetical protein